VTASREEALELLRRAKAQVERVRLQMPDSRALVDAIDAAEAAVRGDAERVDTDALREQIGRLQQAVAARDEFISIVGHELRNPLSAIYLQFKHLLDASRRTPHVVDAAWLVPRLEASDRRLQRFLSILNRLLDVSRISSGRIHLDLEEVDLVGIVRDTCKELEPELSVAQSELRLNAEGQLVGMWDRLRLEQVATNLLSNAIRYGCGKPIEVEVVAAGDAARLTVRDHGIGIDDEDLPTIFDLFERARARQPGGFGVGLWLVRKLCRAMGGDIVAQSRLGEGSTFTATLPRHGAENK
jgi:signal transduction histidine kinase